MRYPERNIFSSIRLKKGFLIVKSFFNLFFVIH